MDDDKETRLECFLVLKSTTNLLVSNLMQCTNKNTERETSNLYKDWKT